MRPAVTRLVAVITLLLHGVNASAQPTAKAPRIGFILTAAFHETEHLVRALDEGLRELGYVDGRNIVFERRFADGRQERLPVLAAELVRLNVDVIVTGANPVIAAVKQATAAIPIVMASSRDPVGAGFVVSLARPGGNITGLANEPTPDALGKNLELLKEAVPRAARVALLWNPDPPAATTYRKAIETAARTLGVTLQTLDARGRNDLEGAFSAMVRQRADGVIVLPDPVLFSARSQVVLLAERHRIPAIYGQREYVEAGGFMSYGPTLAYQYRRAAVYIDKILKGAKHGDLPIEQSAKLELLINLKTAKALGLTIPPSLRLRVDHIID